MSLASGTIPAHYRVVSRLGAGGMGEVYLAQDTQLDRSVALKVLPDDVSQDPERMRRFVQEAKAASSLNHPNICVIHEIGDADGVRFIVMEYVEGQPLEAKIGARPLSTPEILDLGTQIADALDEAHTKGITHRDIKPANILITPRGQVKVLDFGLAKIQPARTTAVDAATLAVTQPGVVMGTTRYMSPEQALGRDVDHRSDVFSLGVVLYEMATGAAHFTGAMWRIPVDCGDEAPVLEKPPAGMERLWTVTDQGIYFVEPGEPHRPALSFFQFATRRTTRVTTFERDLSTGSGSLSASPDGRWLISPQIDQQGSDILLVENFRWK